MTVAGTATLWIVFSYKHQNWSIYAFGVLWMTSEQRGPPGIAGDGLDSRATSTSFFFLFALLLPGHDD